MSFLRVVGIGGLIVFGVDAGNALFAVEIQAHATKVATKPQRIEVSEFTFQYVTPAGDTSPDASLPPIDVFQKLEVPLRLQDGVYVVPAVEQAPEKVQIGNGDDLRAFDPNAILLICRAAVSELNRRGIYGVMAKVEPSEVDLVAVPLKDHRGGRRSLRIALYYSKVAKVESQKVEARFPHWLLCPESPKSEIIGKAPIQAGSLLRKEDLDNYIAKVNRSGVQKVDAVIVPGEKSGTVNTVLRVEELKRYTVYASEANSGTKETGVWRSLIGGEMRQVLGLDDVLSAEYTTSDFNKYQTLFLAEDFGLENPSVVRGRVFGSWSELSLADLGQTGFGLRYRAKTLGAQTTWTPIQKQGHQSLWLNAGAYAMDVSVSNDATQMHGSSTFTVPYVTVGGEAASRMGVVGSSLQVQFITTEDDNRDLLGRSGTAKDAWISSWNLTGTRAAGSFCELVSTDAAVKGAIHEVTLKTHGQVAFGGARLVPQFEGIVGGRESVRGYRESLTAGDDVVIGSLEYKVRLKTESLSRRALKEESGGAGKSGEKGLNVGEIAIRGFVDAGWLHVNRASSSSGEVGERTLVGTGVGMDWKLEGPIRGTVRTDWGFAMNTQHDLGGSDVRAGSSNVSLTVLLVW